MKKLKPLAQRHAELDDAIAQLSALGMTTEMQGVAEFMKIADDYFQKGYHASGDIVVPGTKRRIVYKLSMQPHVPSTVVLKYDEHS
jgi:hypothetical protein